MGRAFEFRRARKERRWGKMAVAFTKLSKEITIAAKKGGPIPETNLRLRIAIEEAKSVNMPKDKIEGAIKRAAAKDAASIEEVVYEGYGPYGIAIIIECATDNPTRTVGNIRSYFTHAGGSLGTVGSVDFLFERKGVFRFPLGAQPPDELELSLIDEGLEEFETAEGQVYIYTGFNDFQRMQKALEERNLGPVSGEIMRIPVTTLPLPEDKAKEINALIEKIEDDEDVQAVYHTMKEGKEGEEGTGG
ncbi:MAG TPA: YebC/PmpR family DNA-binding transcriptional regulator [Bacteroidota bacterium]|nr:YebC/PmpR family DNA-binding transcriptional regulator [Bacteroidota bacterium]